MIERHSLFSRKEIIHLKPAEIPEKQKRKYCINLESCQSNETI